MNGLVEPLEQRQLLAAPHATSIISDNRGAVTITLDSPVVPATVSGKSVQIHTAGPDAKFGTADDVKISGSVRWSASNNRILFKTNRLPANTTYSVKVSAVLVKNSLGEKLDGEFNGGGVRSGNDQPAGDLLFFSKRDTTNNPIARFYTNKGAISVKLFKAQTPITVANFFRYANEAAWDYTFFHRSAHLDAQNTVPFVIQGGGFKVDKDNKLARISDHGPIKNEPGISNTRGTIAMAKLGQAAPGFPDPVNSASNQWFFNEGDNSGPPASLDQQNGGFTAFGTISGGIEVMDAIGALPKKDFTSASPPEVTGAMDDTPVVNPNANTTTPNPKADLVIVERVAIVNKNSTFVIG